MVLKCLIGLFSFDILALIFFCAIIWIEGPNNAVSGRTGPNLDETESSEGGLKEA